MFQQNISQINFINRAHNIKSIFPMKYISGHIYQMIILIICCLDLFIEYDYTVGVRAFIDYVYFSSFKITLKHNSLQKQFIIDELWVDMKLMVMM